MTEDEGYSYKIYDLIERLTEWYQDQSGLFQRFMKYGGWIALQFWIVRAPMTVFLTNTFPETIRLNLFIHILTFPGYVLASFTSGTLLAIVGFFLSEWWIWGAGEDEV